MHQRWFTKVNSNSKQGIMLIEENNKDKYVKRDSLIELVCKKKNGETSQIQYKYTLSLLSLTSVITSDIFMKIIVRCGMANFLRANILFWIVWWNRINCLGNINLLLLKIELNVIHIQFMSSRMILYIIYQGNTT